MESFTHLSCYKFLKKRVEFLLTGLCFKEFPRSKRTPEKAQRACVHASRILSVPLTVSKVAAYIYIHIYMSIYTHTHIHTYTLITLIMHGKKIERQPAGKHVCHFGKEQKETISSTFPCNGYCSHCC